MRIFRIIGRSFINACKSIARNFSLSIASITCTIITLILVSIGFLISYNVNNITKEIEQELTIVVFMDKSVTKEELSNTKELLEKTDNIKKVTYKSKEDIKNQMANENETFAKIIATWDENENPLQDSYIIEVKDVNEAPKGCICGPILRGLARPEDCKLFRKACTPLHPIGACMVSKEGTCNIAHRYSRG